MKRPQYALKDDFFILSFIMIFCILMAIGTLTTLNSHRLDEIDSKLDAIPHVTLSPSTDGKALMENCWNETVQDTHDCYYSNESIGYSKNNILWTCVKSYQVERCEIK